MAENTENTVLSNAQTALANVQTDLARGGIVASQSYGKVHEMQQASGLENAMAQVRGSNLSGLGAVTHMGSASKPVVGNYTAAEATRGQDTSRGR